MSHPVSGVADSDIEGECNKTAMHMDFRGCSGVQTKTIRRPSKPVQWAVVRLSFLKWVFGDPSEQDLQKLLSFPIQAMA